MLASIPADLETPTSLFLKLAPLKPAFLFESVVQGESLGRFSFLGLDVERRPVCRAGEDLRAFLARETAGGSGRRDLPDLCGGLVGQIDYEAVHGLLPTRISAPPDRVIGRFVVPRLVLAFDHVRRDLTVSHLDGPDRAVEALGVIRELVARPLRGAPRGRSTPPRASASREEFLRRVVRAKEYIREGDVFQVVLSLRFEGETSASPFQVYRALRYLNPSPYLFYLDLGDRQLVGSSPEALVTLRRGEIRLRPIAGTRPRSDDALEQRRFEEELLADEKENAEHTMLVDLARNDVGRVAEIGSVRVENLRTLERYSHVTHLVSTVVGRKAAKASPADVFASAFPAGTVTGAPKIRAMQVIDELEDGPRGAYAGSVGYFGRGGDLDQAIAIRSLCFSEGRYAVGAGAGIVADSRPEAEYQEICNKAAAMLQALAQAEAGL